jgi:hypothetical protein
MYRMPTLTQHQVCVFTVICLAALQHMLKGSSPATTKVSSALSGDGNCQLHCSKKGPISQVAAYSPLSEFLSFKERLT